MNEYTTKTALAYFTVINLIYVFTTYAAESSGDALAIPIAFCGIVFDLYYWSRAR